MSDIGLSHLYYKNNSFLLILSPSQESHQLLKRLCYIYYLERKSGDWQFLSIRIEIGNGTAIFWLIWFSADSKMRENKPNKTERLSTVVMPCFSLVQNYINTEFHNKISDETPSLYYLFQFRVVLEF